MTLPPLVLLSDADRIGVERFLAVFQAALAGGLRMLQVREPSWSAAEVKELILRVREGLPATPGGELILVVSRRPALVGELDLDGVHIGGGEVAEVARARALIGPARLVGYSAHAAAELEAAAARGADYASFSPVFRPLSKTRSLPPAGIEGLRAACRASPIPVYALGGLTPAHVESVRGAGAAGVAVMGAILDARDPESVVKGFLAAWEAAAPTR